MLALAHHAGRRGPADRAFLERYCVGFDRFERYLLGADDGCPKTPEWAERLSGIAAATIRALARRMAARRTLINVNYSLQRVEHGEQAPWIARDAGGDARPDRAAGRRIRPGLRLARLRRPGAPARGAARRLPQGENPVRAFIPFARVADMLLHPGEPFDFDGQRLTYPDDPPRLLVRRQSLPPPPGPRAPAPRAGPAGDDRRPRVVLDADGAPRRRRAAGDDDARAERHRRLAERRVPDRDAPGGPAVGRGPERLRDLRRPRREPRRRPALHRGPRRDGVAAAPLRRLARPGHRRRRVRAAIRRLLGGRLPRGAGRGR